MERMDYIRAYGYPVIGVLLCIASLFSLGVVYGANTYVPVLCEGALAETSSCWTEYYTALIEHSGPNLALSHLKERYDEGGAEATFCHPLLHLIGAAAGKKYGSVAKAYEHGDTFCRAGYYHGVLEGIFGEGESGGGARLLANVDTICADIPGKDRYSYNYYSCVHGIGHGLMAYFDHDIYRSLAGCELLKGAWEQGSCYGGVFMENVISNTPEYPSKYLSDDDPLYPCNAVEERQKYQCFQMQTSHMLVLFEGDFEKTFATCRRAESAFRVACFQSLGRDASGWSYGDANVALEYCSYGESKEERKECVIGAAVDYIQSVSPSGARSLCAMAEDGVRVPCIQSVEWQISAL